MASGQRSTWPIVLLLGLCVSLLVGSAVAVATPSEDAGSWWHDDGAQRITATVVEVDRTEGSVVLDELITWEHQDEIGTLTVAVADLGEVQPGDTVDLDVERHDGRWSASELLPLDTD